MPDITMCTNAKCPIRRSCYRYVAPPTPDWQSYALFKQYTNPAVLTCDYYIPANDYKERVHPNTVDKQWEKTMAKKKSKIFKEHVAEKATAEEEQTKIDVVKKQPLVQKRL